MRSRLANLTRRLGAAGLVVGAAIRAVVGVEEVAIYTALALLAAGCWQIWKPGACLIPGAVMLWMYLPTRKAFIEKPPAVIVRRRRREN